MFILPFIRISGSKMECWNTAGQPPFLPGYHFPRLRSFMPIIWITKNLSYIRTYKSINTSTSSPLLFLVLQPATSIQPPCWFWHSYSKFLNLQYSADRIKPWPSVFKHTTTATFHPESGRKRALKSCDIWRSPGCFPGAHFALGRLHRFWV